MFAQLQRPKALVNQRAVARPQRRPRLVDGLIRVRSAYRFDESIDRLKQAIAVRGIPFFGTVDQAHLAASAGIRLRPSTLLVFGAPSLGAQFLNSNPYAGLDWPIRLLVHQDSTGAVWIAYTDFTWIVRRHGIGELRDQSLLTASIVDSIASTVRAPLSWSNWARTERVGAPITFQQNVIPA